ncbi:MAG: hypothetical protein RIS92_2774, partial [Verrucomicrobiota bacterium]
STTGYRVSCLRHVLFWGGFFQTAEEGGVFGEEGDEAFDGFEGFGAHVVLHALNVVINGVVVEAEEFEEIGEELMAMGDVPGEGLARGGEGKATIFFVFEESVCIEALDHVSHASLRNIESGGDVDDACVTLRVDEFENLFEIIFDRGRGGAIGGTSDGAHGARVVFS